MHYIPGSLWGFVWTQTAPSPRPHPWGQPGRLGSPGRSVPDRPCLPPPLPHGLPSQIPSLSHHSWCYCCNLCKMILPLWHPAKHNSKKVNFEYILVLYKNQMNIEVLQSYKHQFLSYKENSKLITCKQKVCQVCGVTPRFVYLMDWWNHKLWTFILK